MAAQGETPAQPVPDPLLEPGSYISSNGRTTPDKGKRKTPDSDLDWLPQGWTVEDRVRSSGATAGTVDKYYIDPVSRRKFRSKKEVVYFLETGTPRKKSKTEGAETTPKEKSKGETPKPNPPEKKGSAANFNFTKVPEKVKWVLSDSSTSGDSWSAFIGDKQVPDSSKLDWLAAFTLLASKDRGRYR